MNCPACEAENREGARFCRTCGKALQELEPGPTPEVEETQAEEPIGTEKSGEAESDADEIEVVVEESSVEAGPQPTPEDETAPENADEVDPEVEGRAEEEGEAFVEESLDETAIAPEPEVPVEAVEPDTPEESSALPEWPDEDEDEQEPLPDIDDELLGFWRDEVEPLTPVELGTVVSGRYVVVEVLDARDDEILYHARDLQRCWQCNYEDNAPDDAFCAQCGATLDRKPDVLLLEVQDAGVEPARGRVVLARLNHEGREFLVLEEQKPDTEPLTRPSPPTMRMVVGQRSDAGLVRQLDEDSLIAVTIAPTYESRTRPVIGLFAVADGMGGHEGGEIASKLSLQILTERVLRTIALPELGGDYVKEGDIVERLTRATIAANDAVFLERQKRENDMGTTLTTAFVRDNRLFIAHVGDCRAYRWNADGLQQLTTDHSVVASMIADGQVEPDEIYTHPHRSVIYRCIGDKPSVDVDTNVVTLMPGDRIIVCCDGLWEMVRNEGIEDVLMQEADPQVACDLLVKHANVAGGDDNISVIVVQVEAM